MQANRIRHTRMSFLVTLILHIMYSFT